MTLTTYSLYLAAVAAALVLYPGPTMLMCMTTALNSGQSDSVASAAGRVGAVIGMMTLSALGLGALLAASECLHRGQGDRRALSDLARHQDILQQGRPNRDQRRTAAHTGQRLSSYYARGFLVGSSNPKALLFFTALSAIPQPGRAVAAAICHPGPDLHRLRVHRAVNLRLRRLGDRTRAALRASDALDQQDHRRIVRPDGRLLLLSRRHA